MNTEKLLAKLEFEQWLIDEAQLLDDIEFDNWFSLMHPNLIYQMPVRVNKEGTERPDYSTEMYTFNDDIELLKLRVDRLKTDYSLAEIPPSRTRRFVSNVSVKELVKEETGNGGLIIIGSHVKKTTEQLEELKKLSDVEFIELNTHLVLYPEQFQKECDRVIEMAESLIRSGRTVAVYTSRKRLDLGENKKEEELKLSVTISNAVTSIVTRLQVKPNFLIAKGGITSSDVGTKGLKVKRATVAGQIRPGIPVWMLGEESKYPDMSYVIFPGNVGTKTDLKEVTQILSNQQK